MMLRKVFSEFPIALILIAMMGVLPAAAQQTVEGIGTVELDGRCKKNAPRKAAVVEAATQAAKESALNNYASRKFSKAKSKIYYEKESRIFAEADKYFVSWDIVEAMCDTKLKKYSMVITAVIDENRLNIEVEEGSAAETVNRSQKSLMATLFVARKMDVLSSGPSTKTSSESSQSGKSAERLTASGTSAMSETKSQSSSSSSSESSTITASDKFKFSRWPNQDHEIKLLQKLSDGYFRAISGANIQVNAPAFDVAAMEADFIKGGKIGPQNYRKALQALRDFNFKYFAYGTMDVGPPRRDPDSGLFVVYVTVNGTVSDVSDIFADTITAVGPIQFSGQGPDQTVAATMALQKAGEETGQRIVDFMQQQGLY
jgi:hypothetical protein